MQVYQGHLRRTKPSTQVFTAPNKTAKNQIFLQASLVSPLVIVVNVGLYTKKNENENVVLYAAEDKV